MLSKLKFYCLSTYVKALVLTECKQGEKYFWFLKQIHLDVLSETPEITPMRQSPPEIAEIILEKYSYYAFFFKFKQGP